MNFSISVAINCLFLSKIILALVITKDVSAVFVPLTVGSEPVDANLKLMYAIIS